MREKETLRGEIVRTYFANASNGFCVKLVRILDQQGTPTAPYGQTDPFFTQHLVGEFVRFTGNFATLEDGTVATFTGERTNHPTHGFQFIVSEVKPEVDDSPQAMIKLLRSDKFAGIGPKRATEIVTTFGDDLEHILQTNPLALTKIQGITPELAQMIGTVWQENKVQLTVSYLFLELGIDAIKAERLYLRVGNALIEMLETNPFSVAHYGLLTWEDLEKLGNHFSVDRHDPLRLVAAAIHAYTNYCSTRAHTMMPYTEWLEAFAKTVRMRQNQVIDYEPLAFENGLIHLQLDGRDYVMLQSFYSTEVAIAQSIRSRLTYGKRWETQWDNEMIAPSDTSQAMGYFGEPAGDSTRKITSEDRKRQAAFKKAHLATGTTQAGPYELLEEQQQAVVNAFTHPVSVISGGPGTGKTTTIAEIVAIAKQANLTLTLCAPTGRAAKRLQELSQGEASTVHRLLGAAVTSNYGPLACNYTAYNQLDADIIVCDEWSMADVFLTNALIQAVPRSSHIVFVGDKDQLPSIGPGTVLQDLISTVIPVTLLQHNHRQDEGSQIQTLAFDLQQDRIASMAHYGNDVLQYQEETLEDIAQTLTRLVSKDIPGLYGIDPNDIQVITPMNKHAGGTTALNKQLRDAVNPTSAHTGPDYRGFRIGDKVMVIENLPDKEVFNGDIGTVMAVSSLKQEILVEFPGIDQPVSFDQDLISSLVFAWAVTVHKSQGGEWPCIVMVIAKSQSFMLTKPLVYTGITRARSLLVLVGQVDQLPRYVARAGTNEERNTLLSYLLPTQQGGSKAEVTINVSVADEPDIF